MSRARGPGTRPGLEAGTGPAVAAGPEYRVTGAAATLPAAPQSAQYALPVPAACSSSSSRFLLRSRSPMAGPGGPVAQPGSPLARGSPWPARSPAGGAGSSLSARSQVLAASSAPGVKPRLLWTFRPRPRLFQFAPAARIQGEALSKAAPVPRTQLGLSRSLWPLIKSWPITG